MFRIINILLQFVRVGMVTRLTYLGFVYISDLDEKDNCKKKAKNAFIIYAFIESAATIPDIILSYFM